jgi:phosphoribosylformylglycinamidine synthase
VRGRSNLKQKQFLFDCSNNGCWPAPTPFIPFKMEFLTLTGESCFAPWEAQKLADLLNKLGPAKVSAVRGVWVYFASIEGNRASAQEKLRQLLPLPRDTSTIPLSVDSAVKNARKCYVSPRNESPWSSKATSIAQVCGFGDQIRRIERGRVVVLEFDEPYDAPFDGAPFWNVIYDRMTENLTADWPDLSTMFGEGEPRPLEVVDIFRGDKAPIEILEEYNKKHGLALDHSEMEYLVKRFTELGYVAPRLRSPRRSSFQGVGSPLAAV